MNGTQDKLDAFIQLLAEHEPRGTALIWSQYLICNQHFCRHRYQKTGDDSWLALEDEFAGLADEATEQWHELEDD